MKSKISSEQLRNARMGLLIVLCNATGIYRRTISKENKSKFRQVLMQLVEELTEKVDNNTIKNKDIRTAILRLTELSKVSIGASQKGINVYLKYYCLISKKSDTILTELDCPIDSFIENACKLKKISLKKLDFEDYKEMQIKLEKQYAMRIIADIEEWDKRKLEKLI